MPKNPQDTAWYSPGTPLGAIGSAVIDGHSGWKGGVPAVFDNLKNIKKGDEINIVDTKGNKTIFIVREIKIYKSNSDDTNIFTSKDGKAHLNLITCTGSWDEIIKSHTERLVVFSDKKI